MSRIRFLSIAHKVTVGQAQDGAVSAVGVPPPDMDPELWNLLPIAASSSPGTNQAVWLQHVDSQAYAYVSPSADSGNVVLLKSESQVKPTTWNIQYTDSGDALVSLASNPSLFWGLNSGQSGSMVTLQRSTPTAKNPNTEWSLQPATNSS